MGKISTEGEEKTMNAKKKSIKTKIKTELGFMKRGAAVLPKVIAKKGKLWMKGQVEAARERGRIEREAEKIARKAEEAAYREERIKQAKIRGKARAKKGVKGARGVLAELGHIGDSMSVGSMIGMEDVQEKAKRGSMSPSDFLFSGFGEKKKKKK